MTNEEFSNAFDTLLNSYNTKIIFGNGDTPLDIRLDEYEKSLFLSQAQKEVIINFYNGNNHYGKSFESSEEIRRYLNTLIKTITYETPALVDIVGLNKNSIFYKLPNDLAFITLEQVQLDNLNTNCNIKEERINVVPTTQDEYNKIIKNPFRKPNDKRVLRLDVGKNYVELISKYKIVNYIIRYLIKPTPIILIDFPEDLSIDGYSNKTECELPSSIHDMILLRAVQLALTTKNIKNTNS